jgi:hypothetical protein
MTMALPAHPALRIIRAVCIACFVGGIAGMIVFSLRDNTIGAVMTAGLIAAGAAIVLVAVTAVTQRAMPDDIVVARAEELQHHVSELVRNGTDEARLRRLVQQAIDLGRRLP